MAKLTYDKEKRMRIFGQQTAGWLYKAFRLYLLLGISYVVLYPILSMLLQSFSVSEDLYSSTHVWIPKNPTFNNYVRVMGFFKYFDHMWITLQIVVICTVCQLIVCSLVGYGLARYKFKGNGILFSIVIMSIIVPMQTAQIPMYLDYQNFNFFGLGSIAGLMTGKDYTANLINTKWVYYIPAMFGVGLNSGLFIFLFRQFFKGLPHDLEDAARVDGCGALSTFLRVMVPNTIPVFVTVGLLSTIFYWNDTTIGRMFMSSSGKQTLMLYVEESRNMGDAWRRSTSASEFQTETYVHLLLTVAPLVIVYIICQKFFTECMDRSGIKG